MIGPFNLIDGPLENIERTYESEVEDLGREYRLDVVTQVRDKTLEGIVISPTKYTTYVDITVSSGFGRITPVTVRLPLSVFVAASKKFLPEVTRLADPSDLINEAEELALVSTLPGPVAETSGRNLIRLGAAAMLRLLEDRDEIPVSPPRPVSR